MALAFNQPEARKFVSKRMCWQISSGEGLWQTHPWKGEKKSIWGKGRRRALGHLDWQSKIWQRSVWRIESSWEDNANYQKNVSYSCRSFFSEDFKNNNFRIPLWKWQPAGFNQPTPTKTTHTHALTTQIFFPLARPGRHDLGRTWAQQRSRTKGATVAVPSSPNLPGLSPGHVKRTPILTASWIVIPPFWMTLQAAELLWKGDCSFGGSTHSWPHSREGPAEDSLKRCCVSSASSFMLFFPMKIASADETKHCPMKLTQTVTSNFRQHKCNPKHMLKKTWKDVFIFNWKKCGFVTAFNTGILQHFFWQPSHELNPDQARQAQ